MKSFFLLLIALFGLNTLFSQELIIDSGVVLKKGVYSTFDEFKSNSPSLDYSGKILTDQVYYGFVGTGGSITYYGIVKNEAHTYKTSKVFGFCDGENVYYNTNFSISSNTNFVKFGYLGRYCYIDYVMNGNAVPVPVVNGNVAVVKQSNRKAAGVLDINNGRLYDLSKSNLNDLFFNDKAFNEKFDSLRKSDGGYELLVARYAELNKNEIVRGGPLERNQLEKTICKLPSDSSLEGYISRVMFFRSDVRFNELKLIEKSYGNGTLKSIGVKAKHNMSYSRDYFYTIGTWHQFHKNGQIAEVVNYNLNGDKNGPEIKYDEEGNVIKESMYLNGKIVKE